MATNIRDTWPLSETDLKPALALALAIEHAPMGVLLLRTDADVLEPVLAEGLSDEQRVRFGRQRCTEGPWGIACREQRHVNIQDVMDDGAGVDLRELREMASVMGFRALDVVPLVLDNGTVIGALAALFRGTRRASARSAHLADLCGRLMALALENARLRADADRRRSIVEALARARVQFVARVSHELRTPLQSIIGYIDLLRIGKPDPLTHKQAHMLERVREGEQVLLKVIDDLLSMARLEAGRLDYRVRPMLLNDAITSAIAIVQPLAQQKNLELHAPATTLIARADLTKVKQILINLLANAVKFTPDGGSIAVNTRREGPMVVIDVTDTGPGIAADKIEQVFQPYVQGPQPVDGLAGTGLGLAISREYAYRMGGSLMAASTPGEGAVFTLRLPRAGLVQKRTARSAVRPSPNVG